jgi:hypothetical protein
LCSVKWRSWYLSKWIIIVLYFIERYVLNWKKWYSVKDNSYEWLICKEWLKGRGLLQDIWVSHFPGRREKIDETIEYSPTASEDSKW